MRVARSADRLICHFICLGMPSNGVWVVYSRLRRLREAGLCFTVVGGIFSLMWLFFSRAEVGNI